MGFQKLMDIFAQARLKDRYPALARRLQEAEALQRWENAVGNIIARHSRAIRVQDEVLWVEVDHPIWKSELHHRKRQILDILNQITVNAPPLRNGEKPSPLKDILFLDPRSSTWRKPT